MNVWTHLQPQIAEHINDLHSWGYTFDEMQMALTNKHTWTLAPIISKVEFNYEHANFTLTALCNMAEFITGDDTVFAEELRKNISEQIEIEQEKHYDMQQEELNHEYEQAVGI